MGNCRSSATSEGAPPADAARPQRTAPAQGPLILERGVEEVPQSQRRVDGNDADWQQGADVDDMWRESENNSMSSCPMGPRNGTNAMYESPLVLGRYSSMFPAVDSGKTTPKRGLTYDTPVRDEDTSPFQSANVHSAPANRPLLHRAAEDPSLRPFVIRPSDLHADPVNANGKMVTPDVDSVCSQNSGSGPLSSDRTMTFRTTSTGHFEAVRSWLVTVDSTSDMIANERTDSFNGTTAAEGVAVR